MLGNFHGVLVYVVDIAVMNFCVHNNINSSIVFTEIFARRKFSPISLPVLIGKNFISSFVLC